MKDTSIKHFGFFTQHPTRHFEYPWILDQMGWGTGRALEIGAGISPIPIMLQARGWKVTTTDNGEVAKPPFNEWGFYDYGDSFNGNFTDYKTRKRFDVIYSISVIEHMTAAERRKTFEHAYKLLRKNGRLLMTIDLRHKTNNVWNKNYGKRIEDNHGTVEDVLNELSMFDVEHRIQREIIGVPIDTLYIIAQK